ncbi:Peptidyl-prolyl cis-trans isomerase CYP21-4 [Glycine max]|nr:Peptidyl-prolyl cis-trans isomerase CYP21-4 [Glycine max]
MFCSVPFLNPTQHRVLFFSSIHYVPVPLLQAHTPAGSATAKQKEEGSFKDKRRDCYILFLDSCLAWVFPVCFVQTLVQQVSERLSVLALKADSLFEEWYTMSRLQSEDHLSVSEGENTFVDSKKSELPGYAVLNTSKGSIIIELYKESAPEVVDEFIDLCQKGHFKGMLFHKAGDNQGQGATEDWNLRGKQHTITSMKHEAFMLGTSKGKHHNKGFDLFITTAPIPDLNEKIIVFGQVIKGEDVVQEIEEVDTDEHYKPKVSIGILDVTLKQKV